MNQKNYETIKLWKSTIDKLRGLSKLHRKSIVQYVNEFADSEIEKVKLGNIDTGDSQIERELLSMN